MTAAALIAPGRLRTSNKTCATRLRSTRGLTLSIYREDGMRRTGSASPKQVVELKDKSRNLMSQWLGGTIIFARRKARVKRQTTNSNSLPLI
ncbi:hypothetical protein Fuma_00217 [Fuerstiella marisgermanici]|uniref:Uncharacterized protein n=1 Tax=Fuerstiella marisgermanici TaxID=1891926 RepID=A0A1P8W993_9PLAN|nr:hypothetical protein Fuma_00217 [Fuerstiella marisgermanici]